MTTTTFLPEVPVDQIRPHTENPRREVGDVTDLAASIAAKGLLEPLVVAPVPNQPEQYVLIAGHRRFAALQAAGALTAPAMYRADLNTAPKQLEAMLVENTQRVDLTPAEEAKAYAQLVAFPGYTAAKAAKATGRSVKAVKGRLALATLPDATLAKMHDGQITVHDAAVLVEFVGTPHYKDLVRDAGTNQFKYTVERIRQAAKAAAVMDVVKAHAAEQGWPTVTSWSDAGDQVIDAYLTKTTADITKALAELTGPHVLLVTTYGSWSVCKPYTKTVKTTTDAKGKTSIVPDDEDDRAAREQRRADLEIARTVRRDFLTARLEHLVLKPEERLAVLRLILTRRVEDTDYSDEDLALGGFPVKADGTPRKWNDPTDDLLAFVAGVNENQAWKALLPLMFSLTSPHNDVDGIRVAATLGYEPSDVEAQLLSEDES